MIANIAWRRSVRDQRVHAFGVEVVEAGRRHLLAVCSHSAPPAALEPAGHRGHWQALLDVSTCLSCLVIVSDLLAADTGRQPGTPPP